MNKIKCVQVALAMQIFFVGSIGYSATSSWTKHAYFTNTFAPIPIAVTLSDDQPKIINHTSIDKFTDTACHDATVEFINVGSPPFTFTTSTTYFLGLSAYTGDFYPNIHSINVHVDADEDAHGDVCIAIRCDSTTACETITAGPFSLTIPAI